MDHFVFKRVDVEAAALDGYSRLFSACFPGRSKLTVEYLRWLYSLNPDGGAIGYDAFSEGRLAAHYIVVPIVFSLADGRELKGCWSLNTATHPDFQGKGLFIKLAEKTYETAEREGCDFVVGVANQNSTSGFLRRLGFANIGQLATEIGYFRIELDERGRGWRRRWNPSVMSWRLKNPSASYKVIRQGASAVVLRPVMHGIVNMQLGDFPSDYFRETDTSIVQSMLPSVRVSFGLLSNGLVVDVPKRLMPSPWNVIFRQLGPKQVVVPAEIRMIGLDLDTF